MMWVMGVTHPPTRSLTLQLSSFFLKVCNVRDMMELVQEDSSRSLWPAGHSCGAVSRRHVE